MRILSFKPGHDGSIALIEDGRLIFSLEAEKDSFERFSETSPSLFARAAALTTDIPDVVAISGWEKGYSRNGVDWGIAAGYSGLDRIDLGVERFFGRETKYFSSSHERAHIFSTAALAPMAPVREAVVLVWEGIIGAFYHWQDYGRTISRVPVLSQPGARYGALFALSDPTFPDRGRGPRHEDAGKLMALAAYADRGSASRLERQTVDALLATETVWPFDKAHYRDSPLYNCGVHSVVGDRAARYLTDRLFEIFRAAASTLSLAKLPLLISGGCGLNCEWNRLWLESELFSEVFVPPCTNDSGSAIGTAVDAATYFGAPCRLDWSVFAGDEMRFDVTPNPSKWSRSSLDYAGLAQRLADSQVVAWVQGRYEVGPRALGHRSLLASPTNRLMRQRLNSIKRRDDYRPIAPCCIEEDLPRWFNPPIDDPYMLYFSNVTTDLLPAVTHIDGTARVQSVRRAELPELHQLLSAFRQRTGFGVLCNTSLNFPGRGFINSLSDLFNYAELHDIRDVVVNQSWYTRIPQPQGPGGVS